jgi:hypothetical protein
VLVGRLRNPHNVTSYATGADRRIKSALETLIVTKSNPDGSFVTFCGLPNRLLPQPAVPIKPNPRSNA